MDRNWSKVSPEEASAIPKLPSREEEIAYLDKFEKELRTQSYYNSGFHPDPARKYMIEADKEFRAYTGEKYRKLTMLGIVFSPFALWLTHMSPAKACPMGIPFRSYPIQHKVRFWSFFLAYELTLVFGYYYMYPGKEILEKHTFPLNTIRQRTL